VAIVGGALLDAAATSEPTVGDVLIGADGVIEAVVRASVPELRLPADADVIDARGALVLPGFVDAHRHAWMPALRTLNGDMTLHGYVRTTRNLVMPHYTPDDIHVGNLVGYWDALDAGVTTMVDFSHCLNSPDHVRAAAAALAEVPIRAQFAVGLNDVPGKVGGFTSLQARIDDFRELMASSSLPERVALWMSLSDVTQAGTSRLLDEVRAVRDVGVPMTLHGRTKMLRTPVSEIRALSEAGLLGPDLLWAHLAQADADELAMVADSGGRVVAAPEDELQMGMGLPKIREWEALGGRPSLGVSVVTAASGDLFGPMRLALQTMRALDHEEEMARTGSWPEEVRLHARDAVRWATANGAHSAGLEGVTGSLAPGLKGDVIVIRPGVFAQPVINPWSTVVVQSSRHDVTDVVVDGVVVKRDGVLDVDLRMLAERLAASHDRIMAAVDADGGLDREVALPS
jgi:cytosine/adenosine deaminase-related metal-dependent hydrolase